MISLLFKTVALSSDAELLSGFTQSLNVLSTHWSKSSESHALEGRLDILRLCVGLVDPFAPSSSSFSCAYLNALADTVSRTSKALTHAQLPSVCLAGTSNVLK